MSNIPCADMDASLTQALIFEIADFIEDQQLKGGAIPWFNQGKLDPWDHCEAIMALSLAGRFTAAKKGLQWLKENQLDSGAWFAKYFGDEADADLDRRKIETNFVAYVATALWHVYLCEKDKATLHDFFPCIQKAINYVVSQQHEEGDIQWAQSNAEALPKDALVTACASILRSLECAINIADVLGHNHHTWLLAHEKLAQALKHRPWRFDRTWESKARFSMDWFYPILSGIFRPSEAALRIEQNWDKFIIPHYGCRCVADEPWVTVAESCELVMALIAANKRDEAIKLYNQLQRWHDGKGRFWTGYVVRDQAIWPDEQTTWTAAAIALAGDALFQLSPAHRLFTQSSALFFAEKP